MLESNKLKKNQNDVKKVIDQLSNNSRQTTFDIAKKCSFSRQKTWKIIRDLEKSKVIWGYSTIIDENNLGMNTYFALVKSKSSFLGVDNLIEKVKEKGAEKLNIKFKDIYYLNGLYDSIIIFMAKDIRDAKRYCMFVEKTYGKYVDRIDLMENIFPLIKDGTVNPNIDDIKKLIDI